MHMSRFVVGTLVLLGVAALAANPGCSSGGSSGFGNLPGGDSGLLPEGAIRSPDGTIELDAHPDSPMHLMTGMDSSTEAAVSHDGGFNDAKVHVEATTCVPDGGGAGPGPVLHTCIIFPAGADSDNECDGHHDAAGFPPNGSTGNGFDDNCNGLVDEGCSCGTAAAGTTKPCYLVPASQTVNGLPVGWCATNSKGTVACEQQSEGAATWSGVCRGAQPPYAEDVCAPGDFNCDGKAENPPNVSCACAPAAITCPTMPVVTVPYPPVSALPLEINAASWFSDPSQVPMATNWTWSLTGGDCDNILPYPTFGIYSSANGSGNPLGALNTTLGMTGKEHGIVASAPAVESAVWPAFSLSGDYVMDAQWTLNGKQYECSVQIEVRAPGLRAEGCWSTEGQTDDLDLHMAKVDGFTQCATSHAWSDNACATANEDCYYGDCSTVSGNGPPNWGYMAGAATDCTGWGSQSTGTSCSNPRLDRDANGLSGPCDPTLSNPNATPAIPGFGGFCGPENINVDAPANGDVFAVGLRFYGRDGSATANALSHVNIYCDGARILSAGYDPTTPGAVYPQLITPGQDTTGDMWKVALVTTSVTGGALTCNVAPTQSTTPDAQRDGSTAYCVDNASLQGANSQKYLTNGGGVPATANSLCYH
jgi:hypothetical protein